VRGTLYAPESRRPSTWRIAGHIQCRAEPAQADQGPEVTLWLRDTRGVAQLTVNPCVDIDGNSTAVQELRRTTLSSGGSGSGGEGLLLQRASQDISLHFRAPTAEFELLRYGVSPEEGPPGQLTINVQLNVVREMVKASTLAECEVELPLLHRGSISKLSLKASHGEVQQPAHDTVRWVLDRKAMNRRSTPTLLGVVHFARSTRAPSLDAPFCVGHNAYLTVRYRFQGVLLSCLRVSSREGPNGRQAAQAEEVLHEVKGDFEVWNAKGQVLAAVRALP